MIFKWKAVAEKKQPFLIACAMNRSSVGLLHTNNRYSVCLKTIVVKDQQPLDVTCSRHRSGRDMTSPESLCK